ncbi:MAG: 2-phosphosulfolactate phosphatase [Phycisphaerae bacterium]
MKVSVVLLPSDADPDTMRESQVVVFDVLRATSTITTAMAAGAQQIRFFAGADEALAARREYPHALLCGEKGCLKIPGFDLGNSPLEFQPEVVRGRVILMATTNGTKAIHAARSSRRLFAGSLLNARATAEALLRNGEDVVLLCAGTDNHPALEDILGAGAVINELQNLAAASAMSATDMAMTACFAFRQAAADLQSALSKAQGGRNLVAAGLSGDIVHCSRLNGLPSVVQIAGDQLATVPRA